MNLNENTFSELRDKVADIKYDTQQVLDRIDSLDAAYQEMTGMEQSLLKRQKQDAVTIAKLERDLTVKTSQAEAWRKEYEETKKEVQRQQDLGQGYYDSMMTYKQQLDEAKTTMALMTDESTSDSVTIKQLYNEVDKLKDENERLKREKEASSGPCGCQAYRDLEEQPTMPVIPKAVAIAIFREGVWYGASKVCDELDNASDICIEENEYCGDFEVSFSKYIDISDHIDTNWLRDRAVDQDGYSSEESVKDALKHLCENSSFECRIHGVDDVAIDPTEKK